jgi:GNAT superfamily N-acetyltransferase
MIRPLKQTNYTVTKRLFQEAFNMSEDPYFITAWRKRNIDATLGYWIHGTLVGAAIVSAGCLHYIYIHNEHRGGGVGTKLLKAVLTACPNIYLTPIDDLDIRRWYVENGFHLYTEIGAYRIYVRHTHDLRRKSLDSEYSLVPADS